MQKRIFVDSLRRGMCNCMLPAHSVDYKNSCRCSNHPRNYLLQKIGEIFVKVVLIKSPKFLAPLLRAVFKVKKINYED